MGALEMTQASFGYENSLVHHFFFDEGFCYPKFGQLPVRKPIGAV